MEKRSAATGRTEKSFPVQLLGADSSFSWPPFGGGKGGAEQKYHLIQKEEEFSGAFSVNGGRYDENWEDLGEEDCLTNANEMEGVSGALHADRGQNVEDVGDVGQKYHLLHEMGEISGDFDIEEEVYGGDDGSKDMLSNILSIDAVVETDYGGVLSVYHHQLSSESSSTFAAPDTSINHNFSAGLDFDLSFDCPPLFANATISNDPMDHLQQFSNKNSACSPSLAFESQIWEAPLPEGTIVQSFNKTTAPGVEFNTNDMLATIAVPTLPGTTQAGKRDSAISSFSSRIALETHPSSFQDKQ